jgi:formiminotetrahydrofolate cyclodeaminase
MIIRMINKFKDDMEKHLSEFKYNTKKWKTKIRKIIQDKKDAIKI